MSKHNTSISIFSDNEGSKEVIRFCQNKKIYVQGEEATNSKEIYDLLVAWFMFMGTFPSKLTSNQKNTLKQIKTQAKLIRSIKTKPIKKTKYKFISKGNRND